MESHPLTPIPDVDRIVAFLDRLDHPRLKVAYDVASAEFIGEDQPSALRRLAPRLGQVHLSDGTRTSWRHDRAGLGTVDFGAALSTLAEIAFGGISVVEIISPHPLDDIEATAAHLKSLIAGSGGSSPAG
jgi:sugar phosphate isomerase/epimerase